jgi:30S ribosomal protein 3
MMSANLRLKVLWLKNCLGLSINQVSLKSQLPITFYYFWPRTEAWEQLKLELDCKPWINEIEKIKVLNTISQIISLWKSSRSFNVNKNLLESFENVDFVKLNN